MKNDCVVPFREHQRQKLRDLSKVLPKSKDYPVAQNIPLNDYIEELKSTYPEMFQTNGSLKSRVFMDEPAAADCARFVRSWKNSPYRIIPV